jgi:hypothetical protein
MSDARRLNYLESSRIRVEALIPIIRAMERELGIPRAHELVRETLDHERRKSVPEEARGRIPERMPFNRAGLEATFAAGDALEYEILREDEDAFDMNVTGCQYKALMEEFDALDLGGLLFCDNDFPTAEALGLELVRTQTCMQGASHCDFRYRLRGRSGS